MKKTESGQGQKRESGPRERAGPSREPREHPQWK